MVKRPLESTAPEPPIVPPPDVVKVTPPLAVTVPLTVIMLPLLVVTESEPAPSLLAFNCILPV